MMSEIIENSKKYFAEHIDKQSVFAIINSAAKNI
jgi:hypothetical protein